jgi:hypothetical protein
LETGEGAHESQKGPITLDVLFLFFFIFGRYYQLKILIEVSVCPLSPKQFSKIALGDPDNCCSNSFQNDNKK